MQEIDPKMVVSFREFHKFIARNGGTGLSSLTTLVDTYGRSRPEFKGWSVLISPSLSAYHSFDTLNYIKAVEDNGKRGVVFCPILDALVVYTDLKKVKLKPCLLALVEGIGSDSLWSFLNGEGRSNFLANTYNNNIDKVLLKVFLNEYFKTYFASSIRR